MKEKITEEQYLKAIEVVKQYHKQIEKDKDILKTPILEWDKFSQLPRRVKNVLTYENNKKHIFLEDLTYQTFLSFQKAGQKGWYEFTKLRGY